MDNPSASFPDLPPPPYNDETKRPGNFEEIPPYNPPPYYQAFNPEAYQPAVVQRNPPAANYEADQLPLDFTGAFVVSGVVFCCCCCVFGVAAFILAMIGQKNSTTNRRGAEQMLRASYGASIAGIALGVAATVCFSVFYYYWYFRQADDASVSTTTRFPPFFKR